MRYLIGFSDPEARIVESAGGKGSNLGLMSQAGFEVPPGFIITTEAYSRFLSNDGLDSQMRLLVTELDDANADTLEIQTAAIRELILGAEVPEKLAADIAEAYAKLENEFVAVRSSGTAEDLANASFAGLHDTFLDVCGRDELIQAVKSCWASLFNSRATAYRSKNGFDHMETRLAVVVQAMVPSEVSGVMFTGDPVSAANEHIVINASWGLGEAVVQGTVTPDTFVVDRDTLRVLDRTLGSKRIRIVRDPSLNRGTVTEDVPEPERALFTLSESEISDLADMGRRVELYCEGAPQDIEWARYEGNFYVLQSRPITGVNFAWDIDVESWQTSVDDYDTTWSRAMADELWTGPITPLMYSWRAELWDLCAKHGSKVLGIPELEKLRVYKFHRSEAYFNAAIDAQLAKTALPELREAALTRVPSPWHESLMKEQLSIWSYAAMLVRVKVRSPVEGPYAWFKAFDDYLSNRVEEAEGLRREELPRLSDAGLKDYIRRQIAFEDKYNKAVYVGCMVYARDAMSALARILETWYDGSARFALGTILTGTPKRTPTMEENVALWELAIQIRESPALSEAFAKYKDGDFFDQLQAMDEAKDFLTRYSEFRKKHGHRGHPDRDIYFTRRIEDPSIDYRALATLVRADSLQNPEEQEREVLGRRAELIEEIESNVRRRPLGSIKAELFRLLVDYVERFIVFRDSERHFIDRNTFSIRLAFLEVNRRLCERGLVETDRDFWFLSKEELFELLASGRVSPITRSKIAGRMRNFDRFLKKDWSPPRYIRRGRELVLDAIGDADSSVLQGTGTSPGMAQGIARVVRTLEEIVNIRPGEILVTNSTDPGWTPVFLTVKGVVAETGGMLAHFSCLSREYGLPAVQLEDAMRRIETGSLVTINGDTGLVAVDAAPDSQAPAATDPAR